MLPVMKMCESIWAKGVELPRFPSMDGDMKTDVLIVGGGLAGLLCAYMLKQAGIDCVLIEADRICHGVTRNTTAKITSQHGLIYHKLMGKFGAEAARIYWQANEAAIAAYRSLAAQFPCDMEMRDNVVYSTESMKELDLEMKALDRIGATVELRQTVPLPFPVAGAIRFPNQAQFHPLKFAAGLARTLPIYEQTTALEFGKGWIKTNRGTIRAGAVIMATHFPILNKHGAYFLKLYQSRSYVVALQNTMKLDGMYRDARSEGLSLRNSGDLLLLGGEDHRTGKKSGGWKALEKTAKQLFPDSQVVCRWATQDCMTLDGIPYIGQYSRGTENLYVATGFNKWGMTSAMVSAMILTELVQGMEHPWTSVFEPSRTVLRPQLAVNAFEATLHLLTPKTPRCPHLGCALTWNSVEHSWDCPCHGSRFDQDGKLLDNPATGDMKNRRSK